MIMLEEDTEEIRYKIYRSVKDRNWFQIIFGSLWLIIGIINLLDPRTNVPLAFLWLIAFLFLWFPPLTCLFLLERHALDKYPYHCSRRGFMAYPVRSFEGRIAILVLSWMIILSFLGLLFSIRFSLESEYSAAVLISIWPLTAIYSFFSYKMYKKKYFF